jgi:hypothetical protein
MRRIFTLLPLVASLLFAGGCAMCCAPYDCDYPYVGGRWVRHNPSSGRVGSLFDEAGAPSDAGLVTTTESTTAQPSNVPPPGQSVIPRNLGERYLPNGP